MWGNIYKYVVVILSEQPRVERDCEDLENRKMEKETLGLKWT